jgi:fatty-acyl-CoA synthase
VTPTTVAELVRARADDTHVGLRFEDESWTWAEVVQECAARAALLHELRTDAPFHVGVLLENVPEYVFMLGAAASAGAAIVGINPTRRGDELASDIRHTECTCIVTDDAGKDLLAGLDVGVPPERVFSIGSTEWQERVDAHANAARPDAIPEPDTLYVLIFTSGSTGAPKAVRGTQRRFASFGQAMPFTHDDVLYCSMPLFHGNALASNFIPAFTHGSTIALRRKFSASEFFPDIRRYDASFFNTVGRALSYVLATPASPDDRNHRVKFALAPESSPADAAAFTERFGIPIVTGYGSSEGAIVIRPVRDPKPGALGRPDKGVDIAIVDADGNECPVAEIDPDGRLVNADAAIGEIVRRDVNVVFEGYYNNDDATAARSRNGWYWSGDLGYRDADGIFYFAGRTADWIRVDGENFAAAPIERILGRHPDVAEVAVYAVPDPVTGDQVMAALELRPGRAFAADGFTQFLTEQLDLGTKWAPRFVRIVDAIPTTGADKVAKVPLRATAWAAPNVWWRPDRNAPFEPLTAAGRAEYEAGFRDHGRSHLLPG